MCRVVHGMLDSACPYPNHSVACRKRSPATSNGIGRSGGLRCYTQESRSDRWTADAGADGGRSMVGAIGRATLRAGGQSGFETLIEEWGRDVRSQFGGMTSYFGHVYDEPDQLVLIVLLPDDSAFHTYLHRMAV